MSTNYFHFFWGQDGFKKGVGTPRPRAMDPKTGLSGTSRPRPELVRFLNPPRFLGDGNWELTHRSDRGSDHPLGRGHRTAGPAKLNLYQRTRLTRTPGPRKRCRKAKAGHPSCLTSFPASIPLHWRHRIPAQFHALQHRYYLVTTLLLPCYYISTTSLLHS